MSLDNETQTRETIKLISELANRSEWKWAKVAEAEITLRVEGVWHRYHITLSFDSATSVLKAECTVPYNTPPKQWSSVYELMNLCHNKDFVGTFSFYPKQSRFTWRYSLLVPTGEVVAPKHVAMIVFAAMSQCDEIWPALLAIVDERKSALEAYRTTIIGTPMGHSLN